MTIKRSILKKAAIILGGLILLSLLVFAVGPVALADDAEMACGDGVCDTSRENNDLCPEDCHCNDNGIVDPGEGCGCKDMICEDETVASACGTFVGENGECPGDLVDFGGVCWDRCTCQGICSEADEGGAVGDPCATYLTCDLVWHNHPVSGGDSLAELNRLLAGGCILGWGWNPTQYVCTP